MDEDDDSELYDLAPGDDETADTSHDASSPSRAAPSKEGAGRGDSSREKAGGANSGRLKIGDHWNAITIIALSQNNPLKAIAEFVENSIDAGAKNVTIVRGKHKNELYLKIVDDGHGIKDFRYVATHIGDSLKRELKKKGATGIQGEFGIGLLSFWTVGETCTLTSADSSGVARAMRLVKGDPGYSIRDAGSLFGRVGTELLISPILPGVRVLSGEKIQAFLASELRDRITKSGVRIRILDHASHRELLVEPRKFSGRLIHALPEARSPHGDIYTELYFAEPSPDNSIGLYKHGTRVMPHIASLDAFARPPWNSRDLEGIVDASFIQLTPGTRDGVVLDDAYESLSIALAPVEEALLGMLDERRRAQEEEASKQILGRVTRALREAFLHLPSEEYGWLSAKTRERAPAKEPDSGGGPGDGNGAGNGGGQGLGLAPGEIDPRTAGLPPEGQAAGAAQAGAEDASFGEYLPEPMPGSDESGQKSFFDYSGPMHKVTVSPASSVVGVGESRKLRAIVRDRSGRPIDTDLSYSWRVLDGEGRIEGAEAAYAEFVAGEEPSVVSIELVVSQGADRRVANAIVTVTAELIRREGRGGSATRRGLPGYTYRKAPGELWRSRYEADNSLIVINNAHADFVYASRHGMTKVRYIARLFAKELVLANFPEADKGELLERMVELTLYTEENLK